MLTVAVPKRNKLPNIIVLTPKDGWRCIKRWDIKILEWHNLHGAERNGMKCVWNFKLYL